jgi:hypothetical protein
MYIDFFFVILHAPSAKTENTWSLNFFQGKGINNQPPLRRNDYDWQQTTSEFFDLLVVYSWKMCFVTYYLVKFDHYVLWTEDHTRQRKFCQNALS